MAADQCAITPDRYAENLRRIRRLSRGIVREAMDEMALKRGSVGVDLGCGIGLDSLLLGTAVGERGRVIGVDASPKMLEEARANASGSDCTQILDFREGAIERLPLEDSSVDWIWCKDVFWPMAGMAEDPVAGLDELCRVLRPGGKIALLYWSSQTLLAGYPRLEALLGLRLVESMPNLTEVPPERHFLRALGWMKQAGLVDLRAKSLAAGHHGPMDEAMQDAMSCLFDMLFGEMESRISVEDWALLGRITDRGSSDYLPRRADYYCSLTYSLFLGTRPTRHRS